MTLPSLSLASTSGLLVNLGALTGTTVLFAYPRTGRPGEPLPRGWDEIPGARGCTPEACGFRDLQRELLNSGAAMVFGLSTQDTDYQREVVDRLGLPFAMLSDADLLLTRALSLPTFEVEGMVLIKRLTLVLRDSRIEKVFYPVFPPDQHASEVLSWLRQEKL
jgi:peroxiredoxin